MASNTRIPPAVNEVFVQVASEVCDRSKMDYEEWLVNSQELAFHLQERWREGVDKGLNAENAELRALKLFGEPSAVAKSLRKPWLGRLLHYKRFRSERFYFFVLAYFLYTWLIIFDTHWPNLVRKVETTPFAILLPFNPGFFLSGFGTMLVGLAAAGGVVVAQWQPLFKMKWLNQILITRNLLLVFTGYVLFDLIIRSPSIAYASLGQFMTQYSVYSSITIPCLIMHLLAIGVGWFGAICLIYEIVGDNWKGVRVHATFAGIVLSVILTCGLFTPSQGRQQGIADLLPTINTNLPFTSNGQTEIGKQVRAWMDRKQWDKYRRQQELIGQEQDHYRFTQSFQFAGVETNDCVYFYENGAWKFHDLHLRVLRGVNFDMDLSLIARNRASAEGLLMLRNDILTAEQSKFVASFLSSTPFTDQPD